MSIELTTFSIVCRCRRTGMLGAAVSTAVPAVGRICTFVAPNAGAVATQSWVNPYLGIDGLEKLRAGGAAQETLNALIAADPGREQRQLGIVDRDGRTAAFTGADCTGWAGQEIGDGWSVQGNMLTGPEVIAEMARSAGETTDVDLDERLMRVLEAGQAAGGDKRGRQSAYLLVHSTEDYPYLSIGVDDDPDPVAELRRLLGVVRAQFIPFVTGMPTRHDQLTGLPAEVTEMLLLSPADRPQG